MAVKFLRTIQIRLPEDDLAWLQKVAGARRTSVAAVVRELVAVAQGEATG